MDVVPRALKGVAKDWFLTVPPHHRRYMNSLQGWAYLLREGFGEDERRCREKAESRFFDPAKESLERYFWDKKQMHERAEPGISELHLMREIWKGLGRKTPWLQVTSYNQHNIKDFRDELQSRFDNDKRSRDRYWSGSRDARTSSRPGDPKDPNDPKDTSQSKSKGKPSDKGLPPCRHCGLDHFHSDCPKGKPKLYLSQPTPSDAPPMAAPPTLPSATPVHTFHALAPPTCHPSFNRSRTIAIPPNPNIVELPRATTVGSGAFFLNGNPLPLEAWLEAPGPSTPTIMGCSDSGGQCLIRKDLVPAHLISTHPHLTPSFTGIGGSSAPAIGYAVMAVYFPDRDALDGKASGTIVKVWIEFQIVQTLDGNFLIGRDATRAYGIDFIESAGHITMCDVLIPIADTPPAPSPPPLGSLVVHAATNLTIPPNEELLVTISMPPNLPSDKSLLLHLLCFLDMPRELHGRIPWTLLHSSCSSLPFTNLCNYPMPLYKGQPLGHLEILPSYTAMSFLCTLANVPHSSPPDDSLLVEELDPDTCDVDPFGLRPEVSPDDQEVEATSLSCPHGSLTVNINKSLDPDMKDSLCRVLRKFADVFSFDSSRLGQVKMPPMAIEVSGPLPSRMPAYRESPANPHSSSRAWIPSGS